MTKKYEEVNYHMRDKEVKLFINKMKDGKNLILNGCRIKDFYDILDKMVIGDPFTIKVTTIIYCGFLDSTYEKPDRALVDDSSLEFNTERDFALFYSYLKGFNEYTDIHIKYTANPKKLEIQIGASYGDEHTEHIEE